ncbi:MAG: signal peptide peptidase SppA [Planctomycetes bacterium]|nr:signal peptide peptidase SppA [Planctomycetota bacterium]
MSEDSVKPNNDPNPRPKNVDEEYIIIEDQKDDAETSQQDAKAQKNQASQTAPVNNQYFNQGQGFQPGMPVPPGGFRIPPYPPGAFASPQQPRKKRIPIAVIIIIVIAIFGIFYIASIFDSSSRRYVAEKVFIDANTKNKIAVISVDGIILEGGGSNLLGFEIPSSYELLINGLYQAEVDKNVKAVIIAINSPGGGMTASDVLYKHIMDFKANTNNSKPVIAVLKDVAASGGYYIASAADYIIAYPTSITGSIGVIMQGYNFSGLMEKFGVEDATVTSVPDKDRGSPSRTRNPYDKEFFEIMLRKMHKRFVDKVFAGRKNSLNTQNKTLNRDEVVKWADGNIVLAEDALTLKMIDSIGYNEDAWNVAMNQANVANAKIVKYYIPRKKLSLRDLAGFNSDIEQIDITRANDLKKFIDNSSTRIWAIWTEFELK